MTKEYKFEFIGTKNDFLNVLNSYPHNTSFDGNKYYYFDDFIVKVFDDTIHFGVERGGHSGGYWFIPTITEHDNTIVFNGSIRYIGPENGSGNSKVSFVKRCLEKAGEWFVIILLAPLVLVIYIAVKIYTFIEWIIRKMLRRPVIKPKTQEDKLFDLMENHLGCVRK